MILELEEEIKNYLDNLPEEFRYRLKKYGFDQTLFFKLLSSYRKGELSIEKNRIKGDITPPNPSDFLELKSIISVPKYKEIGLKAIATGQVAVVVLAGGMASRFGGSVKALTEVIDGYRFLDLKLRDVLKYGSSKVNFWIMTSIATDEPIRNYIYTKEEYKENSIIFHQDTLLRLTPEGNLFLSEEGLPSPYAPGHGRLISSIKKGRFLIDFIKDNGKVVFITNVDNVGGTLDPNIIGYFIENNLELLVEVVEKRPYDSGGVPAIVNGKLQVVEGIRFPEGFDPSCMPYFNTNSFWIAPELLNEEYEFSWFVIEREAFGKKVIQFETLIGEITAYKECKMVKVERDGEESRFIPIKTLEDFERYKKLITTVVAKRYKLRN